MSSWLYKTFAVVAMGYSSAAAAAESAPADKQLRDEARQYFVANCGSCHGPKGDGKGPAAKMLAVRPPNFRLPKWQKAVTDQQIETIIPNGGLRSGKSSLMPAFPALSERPELVTELRVLIRELGKPKKH